MRTPGQPVIDWFSISRSGEKLLQQYAREEQARKKENKPQKASAEVPPSAEVARPNVPELVAEASNTISEVTRRAILDYLSISANWSGRFSDVEFLSRLYDLIKLPSTDHRFKNAYDDIWQHRVNNPGDWQPDWVFTDSRFNLLYGSDANFVRFLCETVHPVVRPHAGEAHNMVAQFNLHLAADGWEISEEKQISGKPVFEARRIRPRSVELAAHRDLTGSGTVEAEAEPSDDTPGEAKPRTTAEALLTFAYTKRCSKVLVAAAGYTRNALNSGGYSLRGSSILYVLIDLALQSKLEADDATVILATPVREIGIESYQASRRQYLLKSGLPGDLPVSIFDGEPLEKAFQSVSPSIEALLLVAADITLKTSSQSPAVPTPVDTRHLIAALLTTPLAHLGGLPHLYSELRLDTNSLRISLYDFLDHHYSSDDMLGEWAAVLRISPGEVVAPSRRRSILPSPDIGDKSHGETVEEVVAQSGEAQLAGYISDSVPDESQSLTDELGIDEDVKTLCSVLLAREVSPPLAVGLFGGWGTGKSYFMQTMYREIDDLAARSRSAKKTAYHSKVVQIRFNAWHYADSNLWASLVSHIFDELSRKVCPAEDPDETKRKLMLQLESAKQLRIEAEAARQRAEQEKISAEDSLRVAREERQKKQVDLASLRY